MISQSVAIRGHQSSIAHVIPRPEDELLLSKRQGGLGRSDRLDQEIDRRGGIRATDRRLTCEAIRRNQTQSDAIRRNQTQSGVLATDRRRSSGPIFPQTTPDEGGHQHAITIAASPPTRSFHSPHSSFSCSLRSVTDEPSITFVSAWMAATGGEQWQSEVISGNQRSGEVSRGHQRSSEVIRGHQRTCGRPGEVGLLVLGRAVTQVGAREIQCS